MTDIDRRRLLRLLAQGGGGLAALSLFPPAIRRALALPANQVSGTIQDVQHVVILMQENRSFDHYFGTMRGVRGFSDRHPVPLANGKNVWAQSDGQRTVPPYRLDSRTTSALRVPDTPHTFSDAQAAWNQGKFGFWPKYKTAYSMGYFTRSDIPFQFALAEAFTLCDAHHCSLTSGTDPNRIMFWSGSNFDPELRRRGENCTDSHSEPNNLRCWIKGALPTPGYTYQGSALSWKTVPDVLEDAGVGWRIYQDPNDNWTGAMHGGLAFASFRNAQPGSALYEKGMSPWSLEQLAQHVREGTLPQVSWVLPPMAWSEHPSPSSPPQGAEFTARVLDALTANPEVWGKTVFFLTFDENDGLFDHVPPPAPPSYNLDGTLAGKSTVDLPGHYFSDPDRKYLHQDDKISGKVRPWGLGPRVPLYVISPWSRGGWVNSQVFDHTSIAQFLEKRFGVTVPAISPWNRTVCGDLTSAFDFSKPNEAPLPELPRVHDSAAVIAAITSLAKPEPPNEPQQLAQEPGVRRSRALPYELHAHAHLSLESQSLRLEFVNTGHAGAVFHVYDKHHLDRIPRRYTVAAGRHLSDTWALAENSGRYDLWVYGPNGFVREIRGDSKAGDALVEVRLDYDVKNRTVRFTAINHGTNEATASISANAYHVSDPSPLKLTAGGKVTRELSLAASHNWYDFTVAGAACSQRFAGRMEDGAPSFSDPAV